MPVRLPSQMRHLEYRFLATVAHQSPAETSAGSFMS